MKNYKLILGFLLIGLIGCNPYEDEFDAIDDQVQTITQNLVITLEDDDYELSGIESVANFGNFSSEEDVRIGVPNILLAKYPYINGQGSLATVSYDFYNGGSPYLGDSSGFVVSDEEYDALGFGFGNFSNLSSDLPKYADLKAPDARNGDYMDITHDFYNGSFTERDIISRAVYTSAYGWMYAEPLPDESYSEFFGESPPDFSFEDEAIDVLPIWLKETKIFAEAGDISLIQYNWDNGPGTSQSVLLYIFDGTNWLYYGDNFQVTQESLSFGFDGTTWVPDNTIAITLPFSAYAFMAGQLPEGDTRRDSMESFGNFDVRSGGSAFWDIDTRIQVIGAWLLAEYPASEVGQKYKVTYAVYDGGNGTREITLILNSSGSYEEFSE